MSLNFQPNPAELGNFKTLWTNAYNGQKAFFINSSVLLYACGSSIKFFNVETKELKSFTPPHITADNSNGLCLLSANSAVSKFAFSETRLELPKVFIYDYPSKQEVSKLEDGALIEYLAVEFSNSEAILTLSAVPDLEVIIWNWKNGEKISTIKLDTALMQPHSIYFSPINWRNLAIAYPHEIKIFNLEQFDLNNVKTSRSRVAMPIISNEINEKNSVDFKDEFNYPNNAITNLEDESGEIIDEILDKRERHLFKSLCWVNNDEMLIVSKQNNIFKYRLSDSSIRCVFKPEPTETADKFQIDTSFEIHSLLYHRHAVFATCSDGVIRLLDGSQLIHRKGSNQFPVHVKKIIDSSTKFISNINFNLRYNLLSISTDKGVFVIDSEKFLPSSDEKEELNLSRIEKQSLLINYDNGTSVSISSIIKSQSYYVLKETGCLQVWNAKQGQITNRLYLNEPCSSMAVHSKYPLAAVGTHSGRLIFMDLSDENSPKIIENCRMHKKQIKHLKFNSSGTLLFSLGKDNKLFVIDVRLNDQVEKLILNLDQLLTTNYVKISKFEIGFYLLGYTEFEGEAVALDVLDFKEDEANKNIVSRVAIGIHDKASWDVVRKNIQEIIPSIISPNSPAISETISSKSTNSTNNSFGTFSSNISQNILFQNAQMDLTVIDRSSYTNNLKDVNYFSRSTKKSVKLGCKIIVLDINFNIFSDKNKIYATRRLDFKDDIIMKTTFHSHFLFSDLVLSNRSSLICSTDRFLSRFNVPEYEANKKASKVIFLEMNEIVGLHDIGYSCLTRSLNNHFIAIGGYDGSISVRKSSDLKSYIDTKVAHFTNGGIEMVKFSHDGSSLLVLNHDNTLVNLNWICNFDLTTKMIKNPLLGDNFNPAVLKELTSHIEKSQSENNHTWSEIKEKEYFKEQDEQYLPIKKEIINGLNEIKQKLQELMNINTSRDDISKLKEHEFYLDLDELDRLHKETDSEIQRIKDKSEFDNLAKLYVREMIKRECWDTMSVKGRGIQAFNTNLLVENYALKERTRNEISFLERVKTIRRIEINAQKIRNEVAGDLMKKDNVVDLIEMDDDDTRDGEIVQHNQNAGNYLSPNLAQLAFKGSIGSLFNGDSNLFYNQFELYTREQKWMQIVLIQDAIFRIKENFNKEFEQIMQRKNHEIAKIREKNQRLKQIYVDLSEDKQLPEPQFGDAENPESLFDVKDEEIKIEKYLTAEQRKQLEELEAELAKKREIEKMDNWRDRGLIDMMGGVLQIRREDELKKDIPSPPFMDKPEDEWTPEEVKQYQAYEQKIKELNDEREKLKKQLNTEINKINEQILECYQNFDSQLLSLHLRKVKTQQAIYQEELKIVRLANSLIVETELETNEMQLTKKLELVKEEKKDLTQDIQALKKLLETGREEYEIQSAEEKSQEKAFSREFSDVPPALRDQLLRLYKKRAKNRMQISKTNLNPPVVHIPELGADNPFSERPTTAQQLSIYDADTEMLLADLDDYDNNAPGGVDRLVWDRFIYARRQKIAMENNLRLKGLAVNDMNLYLQKRIDEDEQKRKEIDELTKNSMILQEFRMKAFHNMQIQLLMKQGQVEINSGPHVHSFEDCLLIHRNVVESLNKIIQAHGKQKITIMVDCKDYKKGIRQLEWEHRKMSMTIEDYIQKQRDITYLRLTREVQDFLGNEDYDSKKQKELSVLEQTLAYQAKQFEKVYGLKAKKLREINYQSVKVANQNGQFDNKLVESNVVLHERKHINEEMTGKSGEAIREEKFQQIIQRRKLVDLAKAQAQEVAFLRSEVERLRMKTFPALVQIEF